MSISKLVSTAVRTQPRLYQTLRIHRLRYRPRFFSSGLAARTERIEEQLLEFRDDFMSVDVGNIIHSDNGKKFEAVRKLGWGVNSTVWIGRNLDPKASPNPKYVALKILTKSSSEAYLHTNTHELHIIQRAHAGQEPSHRPQVPTYAEQDRPGPPHDGWFHISRLIDAFATEDEQHLVLVCPIYGEHMKDYMRGEPEKRLSVPFVKEVARQTLLALDYLHITCGIIHTDVKPENILRDFNFGPNVDDLFELIMSKEPRANAGRDGRTSNPLWIPHTLGPKDFFIVLSDFSHSCWADSIERSSRMLGSPAMRAPELVLDFAYGTPIDIWSFGCTILELLTGKILFCFPSSDPRSQNEIGEDPQYHLSLMQKIAGEPFFLAASRGTYSVGKDLIGSDGWMKFLSQVDPLTLEERIARDAPQDMQDKDRDNCTAFLRRCLRLDPKDRATAAELREDPWLSDNKTSVNQ